MSQENVMVVMQNAIWTVIIVGGPPLLLGLVVGLAVSIFQAATQIQEMTLSFIPKIIAIFLALLFSFPWIMDKMITFTTDIFIKFPQYIRETASLL